MTVAKRNARLQYRRVPRRLSIVQYHVFNAIALVAKHLKSKPTSRLRVRSHRGRTLAWLEATSHANSYSSPHLHNMSSLKRLFAVETLDTRLDSKTQGQPLPYAKPSKWRTAEYYFYYLCFLTIPVFMVKAVYDVSGPWHPSYKHYESLLEPGWIPGRKVDNSDAQYRGFRENIPYMAILLVAHPLLRRVYESVTATTTVPAEASVKKGEVSAAAADARKEVRIKFDVGFAVIFTSALHGVSAIKVFLVLYINYQIATALPRPYLPIATWTFNIGILFANELCHGYPSADVAALILPPQTSAAGEKPGNWGSWVDGYGGLIPRWEVLFNICVLRLISFNFDYHWSYDRRATSPVEVSGFLQ